MNLKKFQMKKITRRQFLGKSALGAGGALLLSRESLGLSIQPFGQPVSQPIGFQVWTIREALMKDFNGTLRQMADLGYQTVEMCSPPGYNFVPLMKMTASEMRKAIDATGLKCISCHYQMKELRENLDERIAFAKELGIKQMMLAHFGIKEDAPLADLLKAADELNRLGERTKKEGIQLGYHNHDFEFNKIDGVLIYDALMGRFDPELIKMQFQVAVIRLGYKAATFFNKYPNRFISMHLADWSSSLGKMVPIGQGIVDWKELFTAAKTGGVKNLFVEMDKETFKDSFTYIHNLKID
jgi:sugar phosphate isomerase/epimerase